MSRVADIIDDALQTLQSTGEGEDSRWTRAEIFGYLNEGQAEIASASKCFRRTMSLPNGVTVPGGGIVIVLPDDCVDLRWAMYDRDFIESASYKELRQKYGRGFVTATGSDPLYWYNDLSGPLEIRLYPNILNSVRGFLPFTPAPAQGSYSPPSNGQTLGGARYAASDVGDTNTYYDENGDVFAAESDRCGGIIRIETDDDITHEMWDIETPSTGKGGGLGPDSPRKGSPFNRAIGPAASPHGGGPVIGFPEALLVNYAYIPAPYEDENADILLPDNHEPALIWYILHRAYEKCTAQEDIAQSNRYFEKFKGRLQQTEVEQSRSFSTRKRTSKFRRT